ncbi:UNVERIFIED_CONTAM: hypothetical protein Sradi_4121000 [Sesamum radiatum]|uniref:Uncharacterized protein n=1 Tax=Sesamum radiatum TaxID=300843 RepID=A0AAW2P3U2_SESRA
MFQSGWRRSLRQATTTAHCLINEEDVMDEGDEVSEEADEIHEGDEGDDGDEGGDEDDEMDLGEDKGEGSSLGEEEIDAPFIGGLGVQQLEQFRCRSADSGFPHPLFLFYLYPHPHKLFPFSA